MSFQSPTADQSHGRVWAGYVAKDLMVVLRFGFPVETNGLSRDSHKADAVFHVIRFCFRPESVSPRFSSTPQ